jgi:hypothetical protein
MLCISLLSCIGIWFAVTQIYQQYQCPEMTSMELFTNSLDSFLLNFKECNK